MQQQFFDRMLAEVYGAFGRERPHCNSPAYKTLWRRVVEERRVPDDAAKAISYALSDYTSMPQNLGKAILEEFGKWLERNPKMRADERHCKECSVDMAGWFWVWDERGQRKVCKCSCNQAEEYSHIQAWTRYMATQAGMSLKDPMAVQPARRVENEFTRTVGRPPEPPRRDHVRELGEAENF